MNINRRIQLISDIGEFLKNYLDENYDNNNDNKLVEFKDVIIKAQSKNPWFTDANIKVNLTYWSKKLTKHNLNKWLSKYNLNNTSRKNIAIIMAGNIPLVGFHDFICVFLSGHNSIIKLSNSDNCIIP
ncbi:MAG: acyl-CoA reductase, partial [Cryomorphaceae bacterium]|nr:acyl-CoA reductase [Cryomorphaceae bacterium]